MYCVQCGSKLVEDALFCPNCGRKLEGEANTDDLDYAVIVDMETPDSKFDLHNENSNGGSLGSIIAFAVSLAIGVVATIIISFILPAGIYNLFSGVMLGGILAIIIRWFCGAGLGTILSIGGFVCGFILYIFLYDDSFVRVFGSVGFLVIHFGPMAVFLGLLIFAAGLKGKRESESK